MVDKGFTGKTGVNCYNGLKYPALKTFGIVVGVMKDRGKTEVYVKIPRGDVIIYRPIELEPLEILKDIFDDHRYNYASAQLA